MYTTDAGLEDVVEDDLYNATENAGGLTNSNDKILGNDLTLLKGVLVGKTFKNFGDVDTYVTDIKADITLLKKLNKGVTEYQAEDKATLTSSVAEEKKAILDGTVTTEAQVEEFIENLNTKYEEKVTEYLNDSKTALEAVRNAKIAAVSTSSASLVNAINEVYAKFTTGDNAPGSDAYPCKTRSAVDAWYSAATAAIDEVIVNAYYAGPLSDLESYKESVIATYSAYSAAIEEVYDEYVTGDYAPGTANYGYDKASQWLEDAKKAIDDTILKKYLKEKEDLLYAEFSSMSAGGSVTYQNNLLAEYVKYADRYEHTALTSFDLSSIDAINTWYNNAIAALEAVVE